MAKIDFWLKDYVYVEWDKGTASWTPSAYQIYSERDWWNEMIKTSSRAVKPRSAKVV